MLHKILHNKFACYRGVIPLGDRMEESRYYRHILNKVAAAKKSADDIGKDIEHPGLEVI